MRFKRLIRVGLGWLWVGVGVAGVEGKGVIFQDPRGWGIHPPFSTRGMLWEAKEEDLTIFLFWDRIPWDRVERTFNREWGARWEEG